MEDAYARSVAEVTHVPCSVFTWKIVADPANRFSYKKMRQCAFWIRNSVSHWFSCRFRIVWSMEIQSRWNENMRLKLPEWKLARYCSNSYRGLFWFSYSLLFFFCFLRQVLDFFGVEPAKGLSDDQVRRYIYFFFREPKYNLKVMFNGCSSTFTGLVAILSRLALYLTYRQLYHIKICCL